MQLTRRRLLQSGGLAAAGALLAGCGPVRDLVLGPPPPAPWPLADDPNWHALNRLTFGPRSDERARVATIGLDAWIEEQLAPDQIDDLDALLRVRRFDTLTLDTSVIFDVREANVRRELQQAALVRAVYSRRQLYEVMVDFWSDHLNISTQKQFCGWLKTIDDREVIRPHALGNFRDLLWASMQSPAMLVYLDNQENHAESPNENYARELLELHTLGVDGGYTQRDVQEVARCLTGWTVRRRWRRGQFHFAADQHDDGPKHVLGTAIPAGGGQSDGARVFELIVEHPATARYVAAKLVRRLVADEPPASLVAAAARTFTQTHGDIRAMLKTILLSAEFAAAPPKIKRPFRYVAGALRQLGGETDGGPPLLQALRRMGQPLFQWATPDGYPDTTPAWTGSLLARWQFAYRLAFGHLEGTAFDLVGLVAAAGAETLPAALDQFSTLLLGAPLPADQQRTLLTILSAGAGDSAGSGDALTPATLQTAVAILLAAPAYQWR